MRVLVSGGAGYIGSHTVVQLVAAGHDVLVVDDFSNAKPAVVGRLEALTGTAIPVHAFVAKLIIVAMLTRCCKQFS